MTAKPRSLVLPPDFDWARACTDKTIYSSERRARESARASLRANRDDAKGLDRLWVYPCLNCRRWHVTKRGGGLNKGAAVTRSELYEGAGI